jgi:hypothetical protein
MKAVLDELRVCDNGQIDIRVIAPDEVSPRPEIPVTVSPDAPAWHSIRNLHLRRIASELGIRGEVTGIVHGGLDQFTVLTSDNEYLSVSGASTPATVEEIQAIADLVLAIGQPNGSVSHLGKTPR